MSNFDFSNIVRVFNYSDPHMGWGDGGTAFYTKVKRSMFDKEIRNKAPSIGGTYNWYTLNDKGRKYLVSKGMCSYSMGWEFSSKESFEREKRNIERIYKSMDLK